MDTTKLKSFAPAVRQKLHEAIGRKLDFVLAAQTADLRTTYEKQVTSLREKNKNNRKTLIEGAAYTWFNRFTALRYLDAQGWHPFNVKILMPASAVEIQPEILKIINAGSMPDELKDYADKKRITDLLNRNIPSQNPEQEAYRLLVLGACRFYNSILPTIFAKLDDETELLLPDDLLGDLSILAGFRTEINDEDCDDVEVIGWLYQFYISDEKDKVIERKSAVSTEDIPAVTQLFTPHWIVRYITENSLGRLWMLNRPASGLKAHMPYYIEGEAETDFLKITKPEEIKIVDPAVGSGHMLTYAFDLLYLIYEEEGYPTNDIAGLILKHNLHGIEICPRAAQLAELALAFKARKKTRRFFQTTVFVRPQVTELHEIRFSGDELREYIKEFGLGSLFDQAVIKLLHQFEESKNFGSLIQPCLNQKSISDTRQAIQAKDLGGQLFLRETHLKVLRVLEQAEALTQRYHVVVANPPYMGGKNMNSVLKDFLEDNFEDYKTDLFSAFLVRCFSLSQHGGYLGFMTPFVWMFITSYEELRLRMLGRATITSLVQLEYSGFDGATVPICTFTLKNADEPNYQGAYIRLTSFRGAPIQGPKALEAIKNPKCGWMFRASSVDFREIPGSPIAFWVSKKLRDTFRRAALSATTALKNGLQTGDTTQFLRAWWECSSGVVTRPEDQGQTKKWIPYNKAGSYRKWYGNFIHVVNWEFDGAAIKANPSARPQNTDSYFNEGVTWGMITSGPSSFRWMPAGMIFDNSAPSAFRSKRAKSLLGMLNSPVPGQILSILNPTLNMTTGTLASVPDLSLDYGDEGLVDDAISIARADWDNFETSWDFRDKPLLRPGLKDTTLETSWRNWEAQSTTAIRRMQDLETENNRLFITAYGLDGELQPEVPEDQITLARADAKKDMAAFLSYAVGCMMGRYSLEKPGLIIADAGETLEEYLAKVGKSKEELQFQPDDDGILPIMDVEWFEDDIVARVEAFLVSTFGADKLNENIQFIEKSLGTDIRSYFLRGGFYKDHLQTYKKRPIYWMAQSPKKAFCALIYLHRYTKDTLSLLLNSYLRPYIVKLNSRIEILAQTEVSAGTPREKTAARKELEKLRKYVRECQEWERDVLLPAAQSRIDLDLDDGVKVNYLKLGDVLTPIPGLANKDEE
jgi:hypothetical protein